MKKIILVLGLVILCNTIKSQANESPILWHGEISYGIEYLAHRDVSYIGKGLQTGVIIRNNSRWQSIYFGYGNLDEWHLLFGDGHSDQISYYKLGSQLMFGPERKKGKIQGNILVGGDLKYLNCKFDDSYVELVRPASQGIIVRTVNVINQTSKFGLSLNGALSLRYNFSNHGGLVIKLGGHLALSKAPSGLNLSIGFDL